jgi:hypothetical protein
MNGAKAQNGVWDLHPCFFLSSRELGSRTRKFAGSAFLMPSVFQTAKHQDIQNNNLPFVFFGPRVGQSL